MNILENSATFSLEASQQIVQKNNALAEEAKSSKAQNDKSNNPSKYEWHFVMRNLIAFSYLHPAAVYGLYLAYYEMKLLTILWNHVVMTVTSLGITAGTHRLWSHRSYKAKWPVRLFLMIGQTMAFQGHIYEWVRDHRVHHKFVDTDADPYNAKRGFFFAHMGWLIVRKHPDVINKGKLVDVSDLDDDPFVVWQRRLYVLAVIFCFGLPTLLPWYLWDESLVLAWHATVLRYVINLNLTWAVNSFGHIYGNSPYDVSVGGKDNEVLAYGVIGEAWHNYHHTFPWDYRSTELGYHNQNLTTLFIEMCAAIGWASDLKTTPISMVMKRAARTGDGSRVPKRSHEPAIWGWDDRDMSAEDIKNARITNRGD